MVNEKWSAAPAAAGAAWIKGWYFWLFLRRHLPYTPFAHADEAIGAPILTQIRH
jgi:hypothetical protein